MISNNQWTRYVYTIEADKDKKVESVDFDLLMENMSGELNITDLQFQEGRMISSHTPHTSEILKPVSFTIDENAFLYTVSNPKKDGTQPIKHENVTNRFYNINGRGHEVLAIPNVFHQDYTFPIVTTGLDLELYAKDDFDLLRISTNDGGFIPGRVYDEYKFPEDKYPSIYNNPLHTKYTREFWFDGGTGGSKIELKCTIRAARLNEQDVSLNKGSIYIDSETRIPIDRQRFMLAPAGSFRLRVEFYKQVTENFGTAAAPDWQTYLKDTGIGYYGLAEFTQWTYGVSKL